MYEILDNEKNCDIFFAKRIYNKNKFLFTLQI